MQRTPSRGAVQLVAGTEGQWRHMTAGEGILAPAAALVCWRFQLSEAILDIMPALSFRSSEVCCQSRHVLVRQR